MKMSGFEMKVSVSAKVTGNGSYKRKDYEEVDGRMLLSSEEYIDSARDVDVGGAFAFDIKIDDIEWQVSETMAVVDMINKIAKEQMELNRLREELKHKKE